MANIYSTAGLFTLLCFHLFWKIAAASYVYEEDVFDNFQKDVGMGNAYTNHYPCSWLTICACESSNVDCSKRALEYIPKQIPEYIIRLDLKDNRITDIAPRIFQNMSNLKALDLSHNNITRLHIGSFQGLVALEYLYLNGNKIRYTSTTIPLGVFKPLTSLIHLNIQQSLDIFQNNEIYPLHQLAEIPTLAFLDMDIWFTKIFDDENFAKLKSLSMFKSDGYTGRCNLINIKQNAFKNIENITFLALSNCNVSFVEKNSFSEMTKLQNLDLSSNTALEFKSLPNITYGIRYRNIRKLKLNRIHSEVGDCTRLEVDHLKYMQKMKIKYFYLAGNRLSFVNEAAIDLVPRTFEGLYLSNNRLAFGKYILKALINGLFRNMRSLIISKQDTSIVLPENFPSVAENHYKSQKYVSEKSRTVLTEIKRNRATTPKKEITKYDSLSLDARSKNNRVAGNGHCSNCNNVKARKISLSNNFMYADLSDLKNRQLLNEVCFCEPNNLRKLYLQKNVLWNIQGPMYGLTNLRELNLGWNSCENISKLAFRFMSNLLTLLLDRNFLNVPLNSDDNGEIFLHLKKLEVLSLSDNKLRCLPTKIFRGLSNLRFLNLSYNFLTDLDLHMSQMRNLSVLSLQNNLLENINKDVRIFFNDLAVTKNLTIDLSGNKFKCTCNDIELLDWFATTRVRFINFPAYTCEFKNGSTGYISKAAVISGTLKNECADYKLLIILSLGSFLVFLTVIICGVIYRYRWNLRYIYYSAKSKWNRNGYSQIAETDVEVPEFEFDVFLSYAAKDGAFVKESLFEELEEKRNMKLLIHDRDFRAGEFVNDNIMHAIITSRKTLIILPKAFLQSHWCRFEMHMARLESIKTGRNVLCVLMKEDVPTNKLPLEVIDIIRNRTYLEMPDEMHSADVFWDRLRDALMN
ncbi:toll-like receptor 4 [Mercenaria mercenaria]|uniref:toll-like receptor 4 n=1 Tax=Mercenaria mercenaria TaxID=6596 RepID=UPI00234EFB70|nr:toll-like receptor 4 [Mercenaria mercenaria]